MRSVIKSVPETVRAWPLGADTPMEQKMIAAGKIVPRAGGCYEIFSQEVRGEQGEIVRAGDYFKVDGAGFPYPNSRAFFEANHIRIRGDEYRQTPQVLGAWLLGDPMAEEIAYLMQHRGLRIDPETPERCFRAPLWGSILTAPADAVLVIYGTQRDEAGQLCHVDYNFVARKEFESTYRMLTPAPENP